MLTMLTLGATDAWSRETRVQVGTAQATPTVYGGSSTGPSLDVQVRSIYEMRWDNVVRQRKEYTCAASALATILTYYFGFPSTEEEMLQALSAEALREARHANGGDKDFDPARLGYNLRHIRNVAYKGGLAAAAFKVDIRSIERVRIPVITRVTVRGIDHFVVFREARGGRVYLADPAFGNTSYRVREFERIWSGVMMGFVRRSNGAPQLDHDLAVGGQDEIRIDADHVMRVADFDPSAISVRAPIYTQFWLADQLRLPIEGLVPDGLRSALPSYIYNFREFGSDLSF